ncbi:MAG TPA: D-alanyl-D-alanine carboxypeptidase [Candidatus Micrarchaeia archaeon]|nr:D-alanyl-D-alanine carboxypeptidase [Candidatus Micrarchaeia archaeon]
MPRGRSALSQRPQGGGRHPVRWLALGLASIVVAVVVLGAVQLLRPLPRLQLAAARSLTFTVRGPRSATPWPAGGQSAVGVDGIGLIGRAGPDRPQAIGSLAKIMTAYLVLRDHPLPLGASGPIVTMSAADVTRYRADRAGGQSVVPVAVGERLSEYQLLVGLLLPSGNNLATTLAGWDAGSLAAFVARMNRTARRMGLSGTHYADASGVSSATTSTAPDEIALAERAMGIPVFAQVVAMPQATLPVAGTVYNVNALVTHDGIVGVKTGYTAQAGGCLVFAARRLVAGRPVLVVGAVLGQGGQRPLPAALTASLHLLDAVTPRLQLVPAVGVGAVLGRVAVPWGTQVAAVSTRAVTVVGWSGLRVRGRLLARRLGTTLRRGERVGQEVLTIGARRFTLPLTATGAVRHPGLRWRLLHG